MSDATSALGGRSLPDLYNKGVALSVMGRRTKRKNSDFVRSSSFSLPCERKRIGDRGHREEDIDLRAASNG